MQKRKFKIGDLITVQDQNAIVRAYLNYNN